MDATSSISSSLSSLSNNLQLCRICISSTPSTPNGSTNNCSTQMISIFGEDSLWKKITTLADVKVIFHFLFYIIHTYLLLFNKCTTMLVIVILNMYEYLLFILLIQCNLFIYFIIHDCVFISFLCMQ